MSKEYKSLRLSDCSSQHMTLRIDKAVIDIYKMPNGDIVLGGIGWFEYYQYEKICKELAEKEKKKNETA